MDHTFPVKHSFVQAPGGRLAVSSWGSPAQPTIVLVHGYPDNRSKWAPVVAHLGDFHVVAYDVRGAGDSFVPADKADYRLAQLTEDFTAVINAVSPDRPVHLVAHDWGSIQSWEFVTEPALAGRIASYTSCSGPCLDHVSHWLRDQVRQPTVSGLLRAGGQALKSWYVYFFHLPWAPEALWRGVLGKHWPGMMRLLESTHIAPRATQAQDGANGVNLYRANMWQCMWHPRQRFAHAPVHLLVPTQDHFVSPALTANLSRWVPQLTRREVKAGHWITIKQPELFAAAVQSFIGSLAKPAAPIKA
jgi:pimeloyl-ACP methyl ester carboxylesterase